MGLGRVFGQRAMRFALLSLNSRNRPPGCCRQILPLLGATRQNLPSAQAIPGSPELGMDIPEMGRCSGISLKTGGRSLGKPPSHHHGTDRALSIHPRIQWPRQYPDNSPRISFTDNLKHHLMTLTAPSTHGNVTELERKPSATGTSAEWGTGFSVATSGAAGHEAFETGATTAAGSQVPRWKTILDIALILLSMPFCLPIMLFLTLWIKLASPGPVFFRQERVGYRGKRFMILKFRTMKLNVETRTHESHLEELINANVPMTKLDAAGDPRIIRGGRIIRAMGLDELPQLFNVLRGDMSLVGPRPCTPHEFKSYKVWQRERVNAAPGLTGFWQVNGKNRTTFAEMIKLDIFYTKNMSLWLDLKIILKTIPALMEQVNDSRSARRQAGNPSKS
jgi:exopolysaccharide production protein ExoY